MKIGKQLALCSVYVVLCAPLFAASGDIRLADAVQKRDPVAVQSLLKQKADVNAAQADGATALAWAVHWNDIELTDQLLRAGAKPDAANDYGVTPLALACTNRNAAIVERLLKSGANPNVAMWTGETPLMTCSRTGAAAAVKALLARGANANAADNRRAQTALMWAAAEKHPDVTQALVEKGADVNAKSHMLGGFAPLQHVTYELPEHIGGKPDKFEDKGTHLDPAMSKGSFTPLLFAARSGDLESAKILVAAGASVKERTPEGMTPLLIASASGHETLSVFLLEKGADPNAVDVYGLTPLHYAVQEGLPAMGCGRSLPTDGPWHHPNMPELVKALLAHGANANAKIGKGFPNFDYPPLFRSCGILMPQVTLTGATPFLLAAASGDMPVMRVLLEGRADAKLTTDEGTTSLMVAAGVGRANDFTEEESRKALETVKMLVDRGADVNAVAAFGRTALHGAAYVGANEIVQYLIDKGAKIDAKDKYGETPLYIAEGDPDRAVDRLDKRFRQAPVHKSTAELLLKLGAAPLKSKPAQATAAAQ